MPFTAPLLAGARVRQSKRDGVEVVVANPSGARGVYILRWSGVQALCHPTVHDTILFRRFARLGTIDPVRIRDAALAVALDGHAGQEALAAAHAKIAQDRLRRGRAHVLLLTKLVEQVDPSGLKQKPPAEQTADLERRATAALHKIAPSVGRPAARLALALAAISDTFAPVGVATDDRDAPVPRLLIRLAEIYADLSRWLDADRDNDISGLGRTMAGAIRGACNSGAAVLDITRATLTDPTALLKRWTSNEPGVRASAMRCDWLLDGWERISLLWRCTGPTMSRRSALLEMAPLIPTLPREVMAWTDTAIPAEAMDQACRVTSRDDAWRTGGAALALIERNEKLIAMSN